MKYQKILLAYNGSQEGKRALFECAELAEFHQVGGRLDANGRYFDDIRAEGSQVGV